MRYTSTDAKKYIKKIQNTIDNYKSDNKYGLTLEESLMQNGVNKMELPLEHYGGGLRFIELVYIYEETGSLYPEIMNKIRKVGTVFRTVVRSGNGKQIKYVSALINKGLGFSDILEEDGDLFTEVRFSKDSGGYFITGSKKFDRTDCSVVLVKATDKYEKEHLFIVPTKDIEIRDGFIFFNETFVPMEYHLNEMNGYYEEMLKEDVLTIASSLQRMKSGDNKHILRCMIYHVCDMIEEHIFPYEEIEILKRVYENIDEDCILKLNQL